MFETDPDEPRKSVSTNKLSQAINNSEERSVEFWEAIFTDAKETFDRTVDKVDDTRDTTIELIKIDLLLASFYVAIYQYGLVEVQSGWRLSQTLSPFFALLCALLIFVNSYFNLGIHFLGSSDGNMYRAISENYSKKKYYKIMSSAYYGWSNGNIKRNDNEIKQIAFGIGFMFASLGILAVLIIVY